MKEREEFELLRAKNASRLGGFPYRAEDVFRPADYDWYGDWEGRAMLAFAMHARMGTDIPCLAEMFRLLPEKTNGDGYFGPLFNPECIDEQQLSGHNWYLRGLLACIENGMADAEKYARGVVENLFLPALQNYASYPVSREGAGGGVSGSRSGKCGRWLLSTDVGCAFMCLDALGEYYAATGDGRVENGFDIALGKFESMDFAALKAQTHATLSACRGILGMYEATKEKRCLDTVLRIFELYTEKGMTLTYENFNWFGREDTWTEPCAVVDSLILALRLYEATGETKYRRLARRIRNNGLTFCLRSHGGAGPNTCVTKKNPILKTAMYEAPFCCTMRYAEGLWYMSKNAEIFADESEEITYEDGRYFIGDRLLVKDESGVFASEPVVRAEKLDLIRLPNMCSVSEEDAGKAELRIYFGR